jgi:hypothetical protein
MSNKNIMHKSFFLCEYNFTTFQKKKAVEYFFSKKGKFVSSFAELESSECSLISGIRVVDSPHVYIHNYLFQRAFLATPTGFMQWSHLLDYTWIYVTNLRHMRTAVPQKSSWLNLFQWVVVLFLHQYTCVNPNLVFKGIDYISCLLNFCLYCAIVCLYL